MRHVSYHDRHYSKELGLLQSLRFELNQRIKRYERELQLDTMTSHQHSLATETALQVSRETLRYVERAISDLRQGRESSVYQDLHRARDEHNPENIDHALTEALELWRPR